jgi:mono/diheme cytochrome c family protein
MPGYSGSLTNAEIQSVSEYLFNWAPAPTTTTTTVPGTPPPPPPDGPALYGASCAGCHGANGGDLVGNALSRSRLVDIITAGTTVGMPSYRSTHSAAEIGAMADYILSITPPPATTTTTVPGTPPPPPPSGSAVYVARCAACHGSSGGDLVGRGISTSRILTVTTSGTTGMPGFSSKLTGAEVDAVVAYVAGKASAPAATTTTEPGATAPTGSAVYEARCAACHGSAGGDLLERGLSGSRISTVTRNGTSGMPGFATRLSETDIDGVVAYLVTIDADPAAAAAAAAVAGGGEEAALYVEFCSACHGAHGQGGRYVPVADTSLGFIDLITVIRDGSDWMPGFFEQMTTGEIGAVARFVESLGPADSSDAMTALAPGASAKTAFEQLCSTCHSTSGEGLGAVAAFGGELDADAVTNLIRNGHFSVPGNAELSDTALEALVEYTLLLDDESTAIAAVADIDSVAQAMFPSPVHRVSEDAEDGGALDGLTLLELGVFIPAGVLAYRWLRKPRTASR